MTSDIETAVKSASRRSDATADGLVRDRRQEQQPDARASAHAVDEADAERTERRPDGVPMALLRVRVRVQVEVPVAPADEEPHGEEDDESCNSRLRALLQPLGQVALREEDGDPEDDERHTVAEPPPGAEPSARTGGPLATRCDQRRHRRDVIGVRRVPETEQHGGEEHDGHGSAFGEACDPVVQPEHASGSPCGQDRFGPT